MSIGPPPSRNSKRPSAISLKDAAKQKTQAAVVVNDLLSSCLKSLPTAPGMRGVRQVSWVAPQQQQQQVPSPTSQTTRVVQQQQPKTMLVTLKGITVKKGSAGAPSKRPRLETPMHSTPSAGHSLRPTPTSVEPSSRVSIVVKMDGKRALNPSTCNARLQLKSCGNSLPSTTPRGLLAGTLLSSLILKGDQLLPRTVFKVVPTVPVTLSPAPTITVPPVSCNAKIRVPLISVKPPQSNPTTLHQNVEVTRTNQGPEILDRPQPSNSPEIICLSDSAVKNSTIYSIPEVKPDSGKKCPTTHTMSKPAKSCAKSVTGPSTSLKSPYNPDSIATQHKPSPDHPQRKQESRPSNSTVTASAAQKLTKEKRVSHPSPNVSRSSSMVISPADLKRTRVGSTSLQPRGETSEPSVPQTKAQVVPGRTRSKYVQLLRQRQLELLRSCNIQASYCDESGSLDLEEDSRPPGTVTLSWTRPESDTPVTWTISPVSKTNVTSQDQSAPQTSVQLPAQNTQKDKTVKSVDNNSKLIDVISLSSDEEEEIKMVPKTDECLKNVRITENVPSDTKSCSNQQNKCEPEKDSDSVEELQSNSEEENRLDPDTESEDESYHSTENAKGDEDTTIEDISDHDTESVEDNQSDTESVEGNQWHQDTGSTEENETDQDAENAEENETDQDAESAEENEIDQDAESAEENETDQDAESAEENETDQDAESAEENETDQDAESAKENETDQDSDSAEENKTNQNNENLWKSEVAFDSKNELENNESDQVEMESNHQSGHDKESENHPAIDKGLNIKNEEEFYGFDSGSEYVDVELMDEEPTAGMESEAVENLTVEVSSGDSEQNCSATASQITSSSPTSCASTRRDSSEKTHLQFYSRDKGPGKHYICKICTLKTKSCFILFSHLDTIHKISCKCVCSQKMGSTFQFKDHLIESHKNLIKSNPDNYILEKLQKAQLILVTIFPMETWSCLFCESNMTTVNQLNIHICTAHEKLCRYCGILFNDRLNFQNHVCKISEPRDNSNFDPFALQCPYCADFTTHLPPVLEQHVQEHTLTMCDKCDAFLLDAAFLRKRSVCLSCTPGQVLPLQVDNWSRGLTLPCIFCEYQSFSPEFMVAHISKSHPDKCRECLEEWSLCSHVAVGETVLRCDHCGTLYRHASELIKHCEREHPGSGAQAMGSMQRGRSVQLDKVKNGQQCLFCLVDDVENLEQHLVMVHAIVQCYNCVRRFVNRELAAHDMPLCQYCRTHQSTAA